MDVQLAVNLVRRQLLDYPQLDSWDVIANHRMCRYYGLCDYQRKLVILSARFVAANEVTRVRYVGLHEIAHALCPGHGHDHVWKAKCRELGISDSRLDCESVKPPGKYIAVCHCDKFFYRERMPKKKRLCRVCRKELIWFLRER